MGGTSENRKKHSRKGDFWVSKPQIVGLATSILSNHGRYLKFLRYIPNTLNLEHLFFCSKCWLVAEVQGFKVIPLLQVKSKVPIVCPGRIYTFCLWQRVEIFVIYSYDPKIKTLFFSFFNILIRCWDTRVRSYSTSARKIFGVAEKLRIPADKWSYRSTQKPNMFKAKRLIEKVGTSYLKQVPWSPHQTIPDHSLYLSILL